VSDDIVDICIDGVPWTRMSRELFDLESADRTLKNIVYTDLAETYAQHLDSAIHV